MDMDLSDEERLDALRRWWKDSQSSIFGGLLLGALLIVGWNMWQTNRHSTGEQASAVYQQLTHAIETKQTESAIKLSERLLDQYSSTTYAEYAKLFLARFKVEAGDLPAAKRILEEVVAKSADDHLKALARFRLVQVMYAHGETEAALHIMQSLNKEALGKFAGLYEELRGDLLLASKQPGEARKAYEKAKELGETSPFLDLKIDDLPSDS